MNSNSGHAIVGLGVISLFTVIALALAMAIVSFFRDGHPFGAAALLLVVSFSAGTLLKFCFSKNQES